MPTLSGRWPSRLAQRLALYILPGLVGLALFPRAAHAGPAEGLNWLLATQADDGSFGEVTLRDTQAAVLAQAALGLSVGPTSPEALFAEAVSTQEVDGLARRALILSASGRTEGEAGEAVASWQNEDGGWGFRPGWPSAPLDTALAVQALVSTGAGSLVQIDSAVLYLQAAQSEEGGWAFGDGEPHITPTAQVLQALARAEAAVGSEGVSASVLTSGAQWLWAQQGSSGTLGAGHRESAEALLALQSLGYFGGGYEAAITDLAGAQMGNGSWDQDPYVTALATAVLAGERPELVLEALRATSGDASAIEGEDTTLTLFVANHGRVSTEAPFNIEVHRLGPQGAVPIGGGRLGLLTPGASGTVDLDWNTAGLAGDVLLRVSLDSQGAVEEAREDNNLVERYVYVTPRVDLAISDADLSASPESAGVSEEVTLSVQVHNRGLTAASDFDVAFYLGEPENGGSLIHRETLSLGPEASVVVETQRVFEAGDYQIVVVVDDGRSIDESLEDNNRAQLGIGVFERVDLTVDPDRLFAGNTAPKETETLSFAGVVTNVLEDPATAVTLGCYAYNGRIHQSLDQRVPFGTPVTVERLEQGETAEIQCTFDTSGWYGVTYLYVVADAAGTVRELREDNNEAGLRLEVLQGPDLEARYLSTTNTALVGEAVGINLGVYNIGLQTSDPALIQVRGSGPMGQDILLADGIIPSLARSGSYNLSATWGTDEAPAGDYEIRAEIDPASAIFDSVRSNNTSPVALLTLRPLADLSARSEDVSFDPPQPEEGDQVSVTALVRNLSPTEASGVITAHLYDGPPESGGRLLAEAEATRLGSTPLQLEGQWSSAGHRGENTFVLVVDTAGTVPEGDLTNNRTSAMLSVSPAHRPDLRLSPQDVSPPYGDVAPGQRQSLQVTVHNALPVPAEGVSLSIFQGHPDQGGALLDRVDDLSLDALGEVVADLSFTAPPEPARFPLVVRVDPDDAVHEADEGNNQAVVPWASRLPGGQATGLEVTPVGAGATLNWTPSTLADLSGHLTFRDGQLTSPSQPLTGYSLSASSSQNSSWGPEKAADGSWLTYWSPVSSDPEPALEFTLSEPTLLAEIGVDFYSRLPSAFQVEAWDGAQWVPLGYVFDNEEFSLDVPLGPGPVSQRFRLRFLEWRSTPYLSEVRLRGRSPAAEAWRSDSWASAGQHSWTVAALDQAGWMSLDSTPAEGEIQAPLAPEGLQGRGATAKAILSWDAPEDVGVLTYVITQDDRGPLGQQPLPPEALRANSRSDSNTTFVARQAVDGDASTYWQSSSSQGLPSWLEIELDRHHALVGLDLIFGPTSRPSSYDIQAHQGGQWVTIDTEPANLEEQVAHRWASPVVTQRLRVLAYTSDDGVRIQIHEAVPYALPTILDGAVDAPQSIGPHLYEVRALSHRGGLSGGRFVNVEVPQPPAPQDLLIEGASGQVSLSWSPVVGEGGEHDGIAAYLAYAEGEPVEMVGPRHSIEGTQASADINPQNAQRAIDGNPNTHWSCSATELPQSLEVHWERPQVLVATQINWLNNDLPAGYLLEGWNGSSWVTMIDAGEIDANNLLTPLPFPWVVSGLRLTVEAMASPTASTFAVSEVGALGLEASLATQAQAQPVRSGVPRTYSVQALTQLSEASPLTDAPFTLSLGPPQALLAQVQGSDVELSFSPSTDPATVGHILSRDGVNIGGFNPAIDLSETGRAVASSQRSSTLGPEAALDDNPSSYWSAYPNQAHYLLDVYLPEPQMVAGAKLNWTSSGAAQDFQLLSFSDGQWVEQLAVVGNGALENTGAFDRPVYTDLVRLRITKLSPYNNLGLAELELYPYASLNDGVYVDVNVPPGVHHYALRAVDALWGTSVPMEVEATLDGALQPPTLTDATGQPGSVALAWVPSVDEAAVGTLVYRDGQLRGPVSDEAPDAAVEASSAGSGRGPELAIDGVESTYWRTNSGGEPRTFALTWAGPRLIGAVDILWSPSERVKAFRLEVPEGAGWRTVWAGEGLDQLRARLTLETPTWAEALRVTIEDTSSGYAGISEIRVLSPEPIAGESWVDPTPQTMAHRYCLRAVSLTTASPCSNALVASSEDDGPPAPPIGLTVTRYTDTSIYLAWEPNSEADILGYHLSLGTPGGYLTSGPWGATEFTAGGVIEADRLRYEFWLEAEDVNGNRSLPSGPLVFEPTPLPPPQGLDASVLDRDVALRWQHSPDPLAEGYTLYRDGVPIATNLTSSSYDDLAVPVAQPKYQVATLDRFGREGPLSPAFEITISNYDLRVKDSYLYALPEVPTVLDTAQLHLTVHNASLVESPEAAVRFYQGDPSDGGIPIGSTSLPSIAPDALGVARVDWSLEGQAGTHDIVAVVDPDGGIAEWAEYNNEARATLDVLEVPELRVATQAEAPDFPEVVVAVNVTDVAGQALAGLSEASFEVYEDGVRQEILEVVEASSETLQDSLVDIVFVVDSSGSMAEEWEGILDLLARFEDLLRARHIEISSGTYAMGEQRLDYPEIPALYQGIYDGEILSLYLEAWGHATAYLCRDYGWQPKAVRVVVPVGDETANGDNEDPGDWASVEEAIDLCQDAEAMVFPLWGDFPNYIPCDPDDSYDHCATAVTQQMTPLGSETGGLALYWRYIDQIADHMLTRVFERVARYEIRYATSNPVRDGTQRDVQVRATHRGVSGSGEGRYLAPADDVLDLSVTELTLKPGPHRSGEELAVTALITNRSSAPVDGVMARLQLEGEAGQRQHLGPRLGAIALDPGASLTLEGKWGVTPGDWTILAEVDPHDDVSELDEGNNQLTLSRSVPGSPLIDLAIFGEEISLSPRAPGHGHTVKVTVPIHSFGSEAEGVLVQLYGPDGQLIGAQTLGYLGAGLSRDVDFDWEPGFNAGVGQIEAVVDPYNHHPEANEDNNRAQRAVELLTPAQQLRLTASEYSLGPDEGLTATATVVNRSQEAFDGTIRTFVATADGEAIAELGEQALPTLRGNPFASWRYYLQASVEQRALDHHGLRPTVPVDFEAQLSALGDEGSFDPASVRVVEFTADGEVLGHATSRFWPAQGSQSRGYVGWQPASSPLDPASPRQFRIYFDTLDAGLSDASVRLDRPQVVAWSTEEGDVLAATLRAEGGLGDSQILGDLGRAVQALEVVDLDQDGLEDVLALLSDELWLFAGEGPDQFAEGVVVERFNQTSNYVGMSAGDVDGDGAPELVAYQGSRLLRLEYNGRGDIDALPMDTTLNAATDLDLVDLDGDGHLDLLVCDSYARLYRHMGRGGGSFEPPTEIGRLAGGYPLGIAGADVDRDGDVDLLVFNGNNSSLVVGEGVGGGQFAPLRPVDTVSLPRRGRLTPVDLNADGYLDVVLTDGDTDLGVSVALGDGQLNFSHPEQVAEGVSIYGLASGGPLPASAALLGEPQLNTLDEASLTFAWSTGQTLAGPYAIVAELVETEQVRARETVALEILADPRMKGALQTDQAAYTPFERGRVDAQIFNETKNLPLTGLTVGVSILDPSGALWATSLLSRDSLAPETSAQWTVPVDLYQAPPGTWTVVLDAASEQGAQAYAETHFDIISTQGLMEALQGSVLVAPNQGLPGDVLSATYTLANRGNAPADGLEAWVAVVEPATGTVALELPVSVSLDAGEVTSGELPLATGGLGLGAWQVMLGVGADTILDIGAFDLLNLSGVIEAAPSEVEGGLEPVFLSWGVENRDQESLEAQAFEVALETANGEVQIVESFSVALEAQATVSGSAELGPGGLNLGRHRATLHLLREAGQPITLGEAAFEVVDTTPPVSVLSWQGTLIELGAGSQPNRYATPDTRYLLEGTDNFSGVALIAYSVDAQDTQTYTVPIVLAEEGARTLAWGAVDRAGTQEPTQSLDVTVDGSPPIIEATIGSGAACVPPGAVVTFKAADLSPVDVQATLNGQDISSGHVIESGGSYVLRVAAIDVLGHEALKVLSAEVTTDPCTCDAAASLDQDGDGVPTCQGDCDDANASSYPGAPETCDGQDNDCDGVVDNDGDADGAGVCLDCDDTDPNVFPNAKEIADGADDDCDGAVDEGLCLTDDDLDGFTAFGGDCDDTLAGIHPGAAEPGSLDTDDDCDGIIDEAHTTEPDADGDGFVEGDCHDGDAAVFPGAAETYDGVDEDCDGTVDEGLRPCDNDGDGVSEAEGDCDDDDPDTFNGADEVCDGVDRDCDGLVDEGAGCDQTHTPAANLSSPSPSPSLSAAATEPNSGTPSLTMSTPSNNDSTPTTDLSGAVDNDGDGFSEADGDCDDQDAQTYPGQVEACDGRDDDCDGDVDEKCDAPPDEPPTTSDATPPGGGAPSDCTCSGLPGGGGVGVLQLLLAAGMVLFGRRRPRH